MPSQSIAQLDSFLRGMNPGQVGVLVVLIALVLWGIWALVDYALTCAESHVTNELEMERRRQLGICVDLRTWKSGVR